MKPVLVFDIETIPDVAGLRRLHDLEPLLSDDEVAELAFQHRRASSGHDFLPLHLQRVAVISCLLRVGKDLRVWSLAEPDAYASHILRDPLPGVDISNRRVLFQISRYDTEVSNAASDMAARDMQLGALDSSVYIPWNVDAITEDSVASAMVIYRLDDVLPLPLGSVQLTSDNNAHSDLRFQTPVLEQIEQFARPGGTVVDTCPANSCLLDNERN